MGPFRRSGPRPQTIRGRLRASFILMAILPAIGISIGVAILGYVDGRQRAINQLASVLALKNQELVSWAGSLQEVLQAALVEEFSTERVTIVLDLANGGKRSDYYAGAIRTRLRVLRDRSPQVLELLLLDQNGRVAVSTELGHEGELISDAELRSAGAAGPHTRLPFAPAGAPWSPDPWVFAVRPVIAADGRLLGAIVARASWQPLVDILHDRTGLGETGRLYLASDSGRLLSAADPKVSGDEKLQSLVALDMASALSHPAGSYRGIEGEQVVGVNRPLASFGLILIAEQGQSEAFRLTYTTLGINAGVLLLAVLLGIVASVIITRSITGPLIALASTATLIADGDLDRAAPVDRADEIAVLARAFNSMTRQLRDLILNLEDRINDRTRVLDRRALQMETSAKVSREITSILSLDELLRRVVELIRDAFGYYHVTIMLLENDELVLRASTHPGQTALIRAKLSTRSLNGEAVRTNSAILSNDVRNEPSFLFDAAQPDTQSELVLPLRLGEGVIGTMDVTSTSSAAFTAQDAVVLQSLADQVAVAIENTRLYARTRELVVVEERNRLARDLHDSVTQSLSSLGILVEGWRRLVNEGEPYRIEAFLDRVSQITDQALKEMRLMVYELRPSTLESAGLLGALHGRLEMVERRFGINARVIADEIVDLPAPVEEELYWIAHEALSNSLKHSGATRETVRIRCETGHLILEVSDNGRGFDISRVTSGGSVGLNNMVERARHLGGELQILTTPGEGATIRAIVPIKTRSLAEQGLAPAEERRLA